jgi:hypothetical protein
MSFKVDDTEVLAALKKGVLTALDMLDIEKPMALTIVNKQRDKVPVDTSLTKNTIGQHIQVSTATEVIDHVGPETDYAPPIEFGIVSKPNYPIQPFVRPSAMGSNEKLVIKVGGAAFLAKINKIYG